MKSSPSISQHLVPRRSPLTGTTIHSCSSSSSTGTISVIPTSLPTLNSSSSSTSIRSFSSTAEQDDCFSMASFEAGFAEVAKKRRKGANNPKYVLREFKLPTVNEGSNTNGTGANGMNKDGLLNDGFGDDSLPVRPLWEQLQEDAAKRRKKLTERLFADDDAKVARSDERREQRRQNETEFDGEEESGMEIEKWSDLGIGGGSGGSTSSGGNGMSVQRAGNGRGGPRSGGGKNGIVEGEGLGVEEQGGFLADEGVSWAGSSSASSLSSSAETSGEHEGTTAENHDDVTNPFDTGSKLVPTGAPILDTSAGRIVAINESSVDKRRFPDEINNPINYKQELALKNSDRLDHSSTNDLLTEELGRQQLAEETSMLLTMRPEHISIQDDLVKANTQQRILQIVGKALKVSKSTTGLSSSSTGTLVASENVTGNCGMDPVNCATALHRLGKMTTPHGRQGLREDKVFLSLVKACGDHIEMFSTQGVANVGNVFDTGSCECKDGWVFWALARLQHSPSWLPHLLEKAELQLPRYEPRQLSALLFCLAKMPLPANTANSEVAIGLRKATAEACQQRLQHFESPLELSCLASGLSRLKVRDTEMMKQIGDKAAAKIGDFEFSQLASLSWAFANSGVRHEAFFNKVKQKLEQNVEQCSPKCLVQFAWALSKSGMGDDDTYRFVLAPAIRSWILDFETKDLASVCYSYCNAGVKDEEFLKDLAQALLPKVKQMNAHDVSATVLALSLVNFSQHKGFFKKLSEHSCRIAPTMSAMQLTHTLYGFGLAQLKDTRVYSVLLTSAFEKRAMLRVENILDIFSGLMETEFYPDEHVRWLLERGQELLPKMGGEDAIGFMKVLTIVPKHLVCAESVPDLVDNCMQCLRNCSYGKWRYSAANVLDYLEACKMLKTEPDSGILELALRQLPISIGRSEETNLDLFLRLLGQLAVLDSAGLWTREAVRTHLHRRPKVQAAIEARLGEVLEVLSLDARSGISLFHCLSILGLDSDKSRDLLTSIEDQVMAWPAAEGGEEHGDVEAGEQGEDGVRLLGGARDGNSNSETTTSSSSSIPVYARSKGLISDEDPSWCDFSGPHELSFDDWAFLAWSLSEINWKPEWTDKILLQVAEERWGYCSSLGQKEEGEKNNGDEVVHDSPVKSGPASLEALIKLGWSFAVRNLPCPIGLLEELSSHNEIPKDELLRFAQPLAYDILHTRKGSTNPCYNTAVSTSGKNIPSLSPKAREWLEDVSTVLRSDVHLPVRAPLKERRRTKLKPKEYPHDTWISDCLAGMQLSHNRNYVLENLYRVPIAFPKKRFVIGRDDWGIIVMVIYNMFSSFIPIFYLPIASFHDFYSIPIYKCPPNEDVLDTRDLTCPNTRISGSALLRRRQLTDLGYVTLETDLRELYRHMREKTINQFVSELVEDISDLKTHKFTAQDEIASDLLDDLYGVDQREVLVNG